VTSYFLPIYQLQIVVTLLIYSGQVLYQFKEDGRFPEEES